MVAAFALFRAARANEAERPPLELIRIIFRQLLRAGNIHRLANDFVGLFYGFAESVAEAALDEADGEVGDVDADPFAIEALCNCNGCAAAAEWVENGVAFVAAGFDDAFQKRLGFLCWISETLRSGGVNWPDVCPKVTDGHSRKVSKVCF